MLISYPYQGRVRRRQPCAVFVAGLVLALLSASSAFSAPPSPVIINLSSYPNVRIDGASPAGEAGLSVSQAGDVNGDGRPDVIVGAPQADVSGRNNSGSAYVVFGQPSPTTIDLASLGTGGFRIDGAAAEDQVGWSVSGAGDVNGDGRPDVIVGALLADNNGRPESGSSYVVFGKASTDTVDLASLGAGGFRIDGAGAGDALSHFEARFSVSGAGDVNGDGRSDVIVGEGFADSNGRTDSGSSYVVFGKSSTDTVDLASLGSGGLRIDGAASDDGLSSVSGTGDVNGDGRPDVIVGAPLADNNGRTDSGSAYVVFGKDSSDTIDLAGLGASGFRIDGAVTFDIAGLSVSTAEDINSDGRPEVIVGAPGADNGRGNSGAVYVLFGKASTRTVDLSRLGSRGFLIRGALAGDTAGYSVSGAGDVNRDGLGDVIVGAPGAANNGSTPFGQSGSAYVVFGKRYKATVDLAHSVDSFFRIDGADAGDWAGWSVSGAGDMNGDGASDVIVGAPGLNSNTDPGSAHVVFSP